MNNTDVAQRVHECAIRTAAECIDCVIHDREIDLKNTCGKCSYAGGCEWLAADLLDAAAEQYGINVSYLVNPTDEETHSEDVLNECVAHHVAECCNSAIHHRVAQFSNVCDGCSYRDECGGKRHFTLRPLFGSNEHPHTSVRFWRDLGMDEVWDFLLDVQGK